MNTFAEKLLDLHLSGAAIIARGYRSIPPDWFVDANDADGHVQSWTECFPVVRQKPVALRRGSVLGRAGRGRLVARFSSRMRGIPLRLLRIRRRHGL